MSNQRYFCVGINRAKRDPDATINPDCGFDPTIVPAEGGEPIDAGEWVVSRSFTSMLEAKIMTALGQRALKGSQDFFVMEHTDGVPTGYYALPRICTDDELDDAILSAIRDMPERVMKRALDLRQQEQDEARASSHPVAFILRRPGTQQ